MFISDQENEQVVQRNNLVNENEAMREELAELEAKIQRIKERYVKVVTRTVNILEVAGFPISIQNIIKLILIFLISSNIEIDAFFQSLEEAFEAFIFPLDAEADNNEDNAADDLQEAEQSAQGTTD